MTSAEADRLLALPSTRKLVFEALSLASERDILDAAEDLRTASDVLYARFDAMRVMICEGCGKAIPESTTEAREALMTQHSPIDAYWHAGCYVDKLTGEVES